MKRLYRILKLCCFGIFLLCCPVLAESLSMEQAKQLFLERNLSLIAERYNVDMAKAQVLQARLFENPVLSFEQNVYNRINGRYFDFGKQGEQIVEIEQVINLAGQRNKCVRLEKVNQEVSEYQFEEVLRTLLGEVRQTFIKCYYSELSVKVFDKEITSVEKLLEGMKLQQSKGNISLLQLSRLQAMLISLTAERNDMISQLIEQRTQLNMLLGIPVEQSVQLVFAVPDRIDFLPIAYSELEAKMMERPDLKISRAQERAAKADYKLQCSLAAPEFAIKGVYDRAGSFIQDYFALGLSVSLPLFNRNQGNIRAARAQILLSQVQSSRSVEIARTELFAAYEKCRRSCELYNSSDTALQQNFEKMIAAVDENFRKSNISMLEFIDYYESYKEIALAMNDFSKDVFLSFENVNMIVGQNVFNY